MNEKYTLINPITGYHYDTNDERFYNESWEKTLDSKTYLELLVGNSPEKFEGFKIAEYLPL